MSSSERPETVEATLARFFNLVEKHLAAGRLESLAAYTARFPSIASEIAREYAALIDEDATEACDPDSDVIGLEIAGYRCVARLGRGGQGVVWKARCPRTGDLVAVKTLPGSSSLDSHAKQRLRREATLGMALDIAGVCRVRDVVDDGGAVALVLDYVPGENLATRLRRRRAENGGAWPQPEAIAAELKVLRRICEIVHAAHESGVVHRDLKPGNIMVGSDDGPVLLDLGVASAILPDDGTRLTATRDRLGTLAYMAPEQIDDPRVGPAADVWALGVCLYEIVTGRRPFRGTTTSATTEAIRRASPTRPSRLLEGISHDFDAVIETALRREPADRYDSARALGRDIENLIVGKRPHARRVPGLVRLTEWAGRNVALASSLAATIAILLSATVISLLFLTEARRQEDAKESALVDARAMAFDATVREAELAAERGLWNTVLECCARAEDLVDGDAFELFILKSEAFAALNDWPSLERLVSDVSRRDVPDALRGRWLLVEGMFRYASGKREPSGLDLIREAESAPGLTEADRCFARAMMTRSLSESYDELERALELDPGHQGAHRAYAPLLLLDADEIEIERHYVRSRGRFAEDAITDLLRSAVAELRGLEGEARAHFTALEDKLSREELEFYRITVVKPGFAKTMERAALMGHVPGGVTPLALLESTAVLQEFLASPSDDLEEPIVYRRLLPPPSLGVAMEDTLRAAAHGNPAWKFASKMHGIVLPTDEPFEEVERRQGGNPGYWFCRAGALMMSRRHEMANRHLARGLELARSPRLRRSMRFYGARLCTEILLEIESRPEPDEARVKDLRAAVGRYIGDLLEHDTLDAWHLEMLSVFAIAVEDRELAEAIVNTRRRVSSDDPDRDAIEQVKLLAARQRWAEVWAERGAFEKRKPRRPDWAWLLDLAHRKMKTEAR